MRESMNACDMGLTAESGADKDWADWGWGRAMCARHLRPRFKQGANRIRMGRGDKPLQSRLDGSRYAEHLARTCRSARRSESHDICCHPNSSLTLQGTGHQSPNGDVLHLQLGHRVLVYIALLLTTLTTHQHTLHNLRRSLDSTQHCISHHRT